MNNNLDLTKTLKDCPAGTKFYSSTYGKVEFLRIENDDNPITIKWTNKNGNSYIEYLTKEGTFRGLGECIIFPSKNQRDWSKWHRPFIDGDVVCNILLDDIGIVMYDKDDCPCKICDISKKGVLRYNEGSLIAIVERNYRFATQEEKFKLFQAIKDNGYKWNEENKILEKLIVPKFKVGDIVQDKDGCKVKITEVNIDDELYGYELLIANGIGGISFNEQDNWELVPNKFDISTLKPFDKVLVRSNPESNWCAAFFSHIDDLKTFCNKFVTTGGTSYKQMIPYNEETEHLLGTNNQAPEFYILPEFYIY